MREALKLALDYIVATNKSSEFWLIPASNLNKTVTAIKEALAQPEQERLAHGEPSIHAGSHGSLSGNLPTNPPQPKEPEQPDLDAICQDLQEITYNQAMRIAELEAKLAQPEQEPMGYWMGKFIDGAATLYKVPQESLLGYTYQNIPVYAIPPQRKPLTDEQCKTLWAFEWKGERVQFIRAIEAAHGIKENT